MFLNDLNSEAQNQNTAAPLYHDTSGRFSRKGKASLIDEKKVQVWENLLYVFYILFLVSTDFILFAGSGNVEVFRNSIFPIPEISIILLIFLICSSLIIFLLRNTVLFKNIFVSFITFGLVVIVYRQFSLIQQILPIEGTSIPVHLAIGLGFAIICYGIFTYGNDLAKLLWVIASGILFFHVYTAYQNPRHSVEFVESYNSEEKNNKENEKFVYFLMPNLVPYAYLAQNPDAESLRTQQIIQGFYQKNNFKIYPKAYTPENDFLSNMVRSLNPDTNNSSQKHILKTRLLSEYWRFYNIRREYINLKDNSLYDYLHSKNYQITAYKSRDFDLCHKNHKINVDRCIEKVNQPINIYDTHLSVLSKTNILLIEWIASMRIIKKMAPLFSFLQNFFNLQKAPMIGIDYSNLYVVNSTKTFDILLQHIAEDSGKQAYIVFVDLPSNMYIYNEFCQIKTTDEWYDIADLPWIKSDLTDKRRRAYLQQTRCLFGELGYFMQKLSDKNLLDKTTIVLQGVSSVNNFQTDRNPDFTKDFIANRLVNMAIYTGTKNKNNVDWRFCDTSQILNSYLPGKNKCTKTPVLGVHDSIVKALSREISLYAANINKNSQKEFDIWFQHWMIANQDKKKEIIKVEEEKDNLTEEINSHVENMESSSDDSLNDEYFGL